ncbi:23S rRNA (cytidine(2498)-2'-O)-methyltransferase RlmM [Glaciecola sp. MF2-115]|uniref:23S rRNA (cytidine(2498)-2'-O)-methyltransferase RlmM n=1 Tax=Glaciecola sp. MF2-115 TaxID=3384827 RepID=UPI0039A2C12B
MQSTTIKKESKIASKSMLFYCREGYEADLAAELEQLSAKQQIYGYSQFVPNSAIVHYHFYQELSTQQQYVSFPLSDCIFARQRLCSIGKVELTDANDRITSIIEYLKDNTELSDSCLGDIYVEHADNEKGKEVAKFCKKFTVPLRQALRREGWLSKKAHSGLPYIHLVFSDSTECTLAFSYPKNRHSQPLGITRLKFPAEAPSRSTLKLEEAIQLFMSPAQQALCLQKGMTAVDLGACPGGWTYQLVTRGIHVEAVDNGAMAESLMATGLVSYQAADGFKYQPIDGHVDWLVCDMIEKPERVSELMTQWLCNRKTTSTIFNLKLPMKQRFQIVSTLLAKMSTSLNERQIEHRISAKHLYHDRDEITVLVLTGAHLI